MPKLRVKLSLALETGPLIAMNHKESKRVVIAGKDLKNIIESADLSKLGFHLALSSVYYPFPISSGKKNAVIEIKMKDDLSGLVTKIDGVFEIKLRLGAELGFRVKKPDLRFQSVTWNGGYWNGFEAYPVDIDPDTDFFKLLPKIVDFELK